MTYFRGDIFGLSVYSNEHNFDYGKFSDREVTLFQGENGCGKTALLAKIACSMRGWMGDTSDPVIVLRFLGEIFYWGTVDGRSLQVL